MRKVFLQAAIKTRAANELLHCFERYLSNSPIDENEGLHFEEYPLLEYALQAADVSPRTALHKILDDLAFLIFYLYPYDDMDFSFSEEFSAYVRLMFTEMGMKVPTDFNTSDPERLRQARDRHRDLFKWGLHNIVVSAFAKRAAPETYDPMRHITPAELRALRGPYVRRPVENAPPPEWVYWAEDVLREAELARLILEAAGAKRGVRFG